MCYEFRCREYRNLLMYHLSIPGIVHAIDVASAPVCPVASAIETGASASVSLFCENPTFSR